MKTLEQHRDAIRESPSSVAARLSPIVSSKIETKHLARLAVVYVRQSSARQVRENIESTQLQYDLARLAQSYGWPDNRIDIIDDDLGISGKSVEGRSGFRRLLAEISLEHVGIVMGIEMSRLARNCRDWHQLLELCAIFGTLLGDADGIYNPREHNDRLLLGLKGTMSEAELHVLRSRLDAGKKNKAKRGEYVGEAPLGYVRTRDGVELEPDAQAQGVVRLLFDKFAELGSAHAVLKFFHKEGILIGRRISNGPRPGEMTWRRANRSTILYVLRHPIYAGAYVYGRSKSVTTSGPNATRKTTQRRVGKDEWGVLIRDKVPAYITWDQWERNQEKLRANSTRFGCGVSRGASILAGRVVCGKCGAGMSVHYRDGTPTFDCRLANLQYGGNDCQSLNGRWLEPMIEELVLQPLEPASIQLSLEAADDIEKDRAHLETHHKQSLERATYQADIARRRYEEVDPSNRLVAAELEKRWEAALVNQRKHEEALNRFRQETLTTLTQEEQGKITTLANNFRSLWTSEITSSKDRQDLVRILIERVVVEVIGGTERLSVTVHWAGGYTSQHETRRTVSTFDELEDSEALLKRTQQLYNSGCPRSELIKRLNDEGFRPARKSQFTKSSINALMLVLRRKSMIGARPKVTKPFWRSKELSDELGINPSTLTGWRRRGWVQAKKLGRRWIYWADDADLPRLKKLAAHPPSGSTQAPQELTTLAAIMPIEAT
jgi:DNA invertase Pin-like site-specific DNA recombinase